MGYIGQQLPADVFSGFTIDKFTGDGTANKALTLSEAPFNETAVLVTIDGVVQEPTDDFTVSGTTLTLVGTAANGSEINVTHLSGPVPVTQAASLDLNGASDKLILDADADTTISADTDDQIDIKVGNADILNITNSSSDAVITQGVQDKDIIFKGNDGGSAVTALTLDMSDAGAATLNNGLTLTDGNLTVASGHGINFAADANATNMSAELLDDYEEGTWTGVYKSTAGVMTMSSNTTGRYVKIGRFVLVTGYFGAAANNNANTSQTLQLSGLPFIVGSSDNTYYTGQAVSYYTGLALSTGGVPGQYAAVNDDVLVFTQMGIGAADVSNMTVANLSEDGAMMVSASYYTTA